jgi:hypothetical protein
LPELPPPLPQPVTSDRPTIFGKDMTYIWDEKEEAPSGRLSCQNVLSRVPGVTAACRRQVNSDEISSAFFFSLMISLSGGLLPAPKKKI